jgi:hypothetical protein
MTIDTKLKQAERRVYEQVQRSVSKPGLLLVSLDRSQKRYCLLQLRLEASATPLCQVLLFLVHTNREMKLKNLKVYRGALIRDCFM